MSFVSAGGKRLTLARYVVTLAACTLACVAVAVLAPLLGQTLDGHFELLGPGAYAVDSPDHYLVAVRMPRVLAALLVGGALGGAGCALQALLRNPLAEPFTLGISSGGALAAVIAIWLGVAGAFGGWGVSLAALAGSAIALVIVERLATVGRTLPPATLVLAGVAISMVCSAMSAVIQIIAKFDVGNDIFTWMVGGFDSSRLVQAQYAAIPIVLGLVVLVSRARELDALAGGPELAASLGVAVERTQRLVLVTVSLLVGIAVALAGPIGFVGLVVPHVLRALLGPDHRLLLPASILGGATLLVVCDTIARTALTTHLPAGAITAILGGGFFLAILVRHKRSASL